MFVPSQYSCCQYLYIVEKHCNPSGIPQERSICQPNKPFDNISPFVVQKGFEGPSGTPVSVRRYLDNTHVVFTTFYDQLDEPYAFT